MSDEFITFSLSTDVKKSLSSYLRKKEQVMGNNLRTKLKESLEYIRDKMEEYAPEQTGKLKRTISSLPISSKGLSFSLEKNGKMTFYFALNRQKDKQILWVDRGTGVYGPTGQPIRPVSSNFLYFEVNGQLIRTRSVLGQKGQRFIQSALNVSKLIVQSKIRSAIKES